jgi:hypothetical protein
LILDEAPRKLGIAAGARVVLVGAPARFERLLDPLPAGVRIARRASGPLDVALLFVTRRRELERRLGALRRALTPSGGLWVCWPKRASGVATDMTEDVVREVALPCGLVDNKVCAIDATWSGLRLVLRRELR